MTAAQLDDLLARALRGDCPLDELLAALDRAAAREPAVAQEFMRSVEARYARNEVRYDAFLVLKDRFMASGRTAATVARDDATRLRPAPEGATQLRGAAPRASRVADDATQLRREPTAAEVVTAECGSS